jgi:transposase
MKPSTLLPCIEGIHIKSIANTANSIVLHLSAVAPSASCPLCGHVSERIHSHYQRTLADLPWNRVAVRIHLKARKFYCDIPTCPRRIFTEPLPELVARYARKTNRLQEALYLIGYALGGEAGARVAVGLGLAVSPDTLLNRVRQVAVIRNSAPEGVRVLGVDDWAFRRGQRYGSILVDLQRHRVLDLLPDRTAESLTEWLKTHRDVEIVSRDRGGNYAAGTREGAPNAIQVADRFHLVKNVTDMLERLLTRQHRHLRETARQIALTTSSAAVSEAPVEKRETSVARSPTRAQQQSAHRRERRLARYEQVIELHNEGATLREIARRLRLSRNTVKKWISAGCFREQAKRSSRSGKLTPFHVYLKQRWEEGCHNALRLFAEIQEQGYTGSVNLVERYVKPWREKQQSQLCPHREVPPSSRCVLWWLLGHYTKTDPDLRTKQIAFIQQLCQLCPEIQTAQELAVRFQKMVKQRCLADFDTWLEDAVSSSIVELQTFAQGLRQDYEAVSAALSSEYSNGQVEGQVNRLKMLKRQMYGRAKLDLLRARVLPLAQAA